MDDRGAWKRRLLAGCDEDQIAAITSPAAPLLVVAGAGSGKTRVLTRRIAWRVHDASATPGHVLALTFTRKAAAELRARLASLGLPAPVTAGTFHAIALAELRRRAAETGRRPTVLLESKVRLLARVVPEPSAPPGRGPGERRGSLASVAAEIEWAKARLVTPEHYARQASAARRTPPLPLEVVAQAYAAYERERRRRGLVDFDDLLIGLVQEMAEDRDFAAAQRWRFAHLFVDELQDANAAQLALLDAWLGGRSDLFAVGDPRQAIYGWNGADPSGVLEFAQRYPGGEVLALDTNYRSSPQVVALAAAALGPHQAQRGPNVPRASAPRSARPGGMVPTLRAYPSAEAEAKGIAAALRTRHHPGRPWSRCAVLARTNAQLLELEQALREANIPVRSAAGAAFLARPAVRAALAELSPGTGPAALRTFLEQLIERAELDTTAPQAPSIEERVELEALAQLGMEYLDLDPNGRGDGFSGYVRQALRGEPSPGGHDAVELTTFHRAKGLEWSVVFVTGLEDGLVPIAHASGRAALEEERRLLYVALSRAEDELHCSWAMTRRFGSRSVERSPSPFIEPIEAIRRRLEGEASIVPERARAHLAAARAQLPRTERA
ncbi:MAG: ATP-dependent helicase [Actinomycetota bacterium]|nr:ATP-dependent helicase [Actinomycetota bacterium]